MSEINDNSIQLNSDMSMNLIITADDFGYDVDRNRGIVECFKNGAVTRTSVLVNGSACCDACMLAKRFNIPIGLHLNLTEGIPVSNAQEIQSLLTESGHFLGKHGFREAVQKNSVLMEDVKKEIISQIMRFQSLMDELPAHVDGHQHFHVLPSICRTLAEILSHFGIKSIRLPFEQGLETCTWLPQTAMGFYRSVALQAIDAGICFKSYGISYPDGFLGMAVMGKNMTCSRLQQQILNCFERLSKERMISNQPIKVNCELMVHPGYPCTDVTSGGCGIGADDFATSEERKHEMHVLCDESMKKFYKAFNIQLSSS